MQNPIEYLGSQTQFTPIHPFSGFLSSALGEFFAFFSSATAAVQKWIADLRSAEKCAPRQYPILLSYLYLINYYLMPFWTFVNVCFWLFKMGCRTCRECKSLCQFIKFMPLMPVAFVSGRSGRKAHKRPDPHNCKCCLDILPGTFVNVLCALVFHEEFNEVVFR